MFSVCTSLTNIDLSNFNTQNVINMNYIFCGCLGSFIDIYLLFNPQRGHDRQDSGQHLHRTEQGYQGYSGEIQGHPLQGQQKAMKPYIDIVDSIKASSMTKFDGLI